MENLLNKDGSISDPYRNYIALSRYARWLDEEGRRETWSETVDRYMTFMKEHLKENNQYDIPEKEYKEVRSAILNQEVLPSMRALMTSGKALERSNIAGYNCSALPIDSPRAFDELLYILMNGTGGGYSVESQYVNQLPIVNEHFEQTDSTLVVADSKEGWARSLRELIALLYSGQIPKWDLSKVRPAGERLKVFGGRSSGPEPLDELFHYTVELFTKAAGRKLTTLEAHDLCCKIASVVVVGGVRRAALISLSDLDDHRMRTAKSGQWWDVANERALANNSAVYESKPPIDQFMEEWLSLINSKSGERGIFNREANQNQASKYGLRDEKVDYLTNPCQSYATLLLTNKGLRKIGELADNNEKFKILNGNGEWADSFAWETGVKKTYTVELVNGLSIDLTEDHIVEVMGSSGEKHPTYNVPTEVKVKDLEPGMKVRPFISPIREWEGKDVSKDALAWGLLFGDGSRSKDSKHVYICTREEEVIDFLSEYYGDRFSLSNLDKACYSINKERKNLPFELDLLPERELPEEIFTWSAESVRLFLKGLFSANGGAMPKHTRVDLKATNKNMVKQVQILLSALGFNSYITTNKPQEIEWDNGTYTSRESYDLNISGEEQYERFLKEIGFLHKHKMISVTDDPVKYRMKATEIRSITYKDVERVFDFNEEITHWGWANGMKIHNCCVVPDTILSTSEGPRKISEIDSEFIAVVDGKEYKAKRPWISGVGKVYKLSTEEGYEIELTNDHRIMTEDRGWQEAQNLIVGEKIKLGNPVGEKKFATVKSFEYVGESEVWDTEVEEVHAFDANGIYAHNSEIILRPNQFCNLSTVAIREEDDMKSLKRKIRIATILGTWQSTLTNFRYLRKVWQKNTEEERLLGVSMTGQFGNKFLNGKESGLEERLDDLREHARKVNEKLAPEIGIPVSAAITCVKPEGNSSQLTLTASGLHPWYSDYYIRTVRSDNKDPLTQFLMDQGVPNEPEKMNPQATTVFSFPIKAPEGSITRDDISSIEHLELWLTYQRHYCEHKPSVTIYVKEEDWLEVGAWVYKNFDEISGVSFLPHSDHTYEQAPYQEITKEQYEAAVEKMPKEIYWQGLKMYEVEDSTTGTQELACVAGNCEV